MRYHRPSYQFHYWHIFFKFYLDSLSKWFAHFNLLIFLSLRPASHPYHDMDRVLSKITKDFSWLNGLSSHMIFRISAAPNELCYHLSKALFLISTTLWLVTSLKNLDHLLSLLYPSFQPCLLLSIILVQAFLAFPLNGIVQWQVNKHSNITCRLSYYPTNCYSLLVIRKKANIYWMSALPVIGTALVTFQVLTIPIWKHSQNLKLKKLRFSKTRWPI